MLPTRILARSHRVVVVGAGAAGSSVAHQLLRTGQYKQDDVAVIDPASTHHYQPGWTLVGAGIKDKHDLARPISSILDSKLYRYTAPVAKFNPDNNQVELGDGEKVDYDNLIVAPGIEIKLDAVKGLRQALDDPASNVATIYRYEYCDKVWDVIQRFKGGKALFTQPKGLIKCAGAPQKIMWLARDYWLKQGISPADMNIAFATALPVMFGVPRYSQTLEALRKERDVEGLFAHNLVAVEGNQATLETAEGDKVTRQFDMLHATPPMGAYDFVASSPLADAAGLVDVDPATLRHLRYDNVWSLGDASSLPTSKTAAAVTAQAPVLVENLLASTKAKEEGRDNVDLPAAYDGYTSCPMPTDYKHLLLAEFAYGGKPKESFSTLIDQSQPSRLLLPLKTRFFPWVYFNNMVKGTWAGPKGFKL